MKLFLLLLVLAAFTQTAFLPVNLCLVILICRSYVVDDWINLIGAFFAGILLGVLSAQNIGFWALIFVLLVKIIYLLRRLPILNNSRTVVSVCLVVVLTSSLLEKLVLGKEINFITILIETVLSLPLFLIFSFWEDRFVVTTQPKLRIRDR